MIIIESKTVTALIAPVHLDIMGKHYAAGGTLRIPKADIPICLTYRAVAYVPLFLIAEAMGMALNWNNQTQTYSLCNDDPCPGETKAESIIALGKQYLGTPYKFGASPLQTRNFDCSSFVQHVFSQHGITLPRNSRQQSTVGTEILKSALRKGDLVYFWSAEKGAGIVRHVAIYTGNGGLLHAVNGQGVSVAYLNDPKWTTQYMMSRRVILPEPRT